MDEGNRWNAGEILNVMESTASGNASETREKVSSPWSAWIDRTVDGVVAAVVEEVYPERQANVSFRAGVTDFVRAHVEAMVSAVRLGGGRVSVNKETSRRLGRWLAEQRIPLDTVKDFYWTAMRCMLDLWAETQWTGLGHEGAASGTLVTRITRVVMDFTEEGKNAAVAAHEEATADFLRGGNPRRRDLAIEIIDGRHLKTTSALEVDLGYRLSGAHLAVLIDAKHRDQADRVFRNAQAATRARDRLLVSLGASTWVAWLGHPRHVDPTTLETLHDVLRRTGVNTAVGGPRNGIGGFRRAYEEARRIEDMRSMLSVDGDCCLNFSEFALEALLLSDVSAASAFAADELGELADQTPRAARIRGTLLAWLSSGSQTLTASRLGIHENTVRLRLATAANALGPDFTERRTELLTALRLHRALGADRLLTAAGRTDSET
ncbi:helix-turn-helix domain-containing protein [Streptomyces sp. NPDC046984]|uniref:PucR family transcriptional regulator n=1 Tax=Streptomyces sp. NPDC046984 TaxID=3155138 RepID=UPI0033C9ED02